MLWFMDALTTGWDFLLGSDLVNTKALVEMPDSRPCFSWPPFDDILICFVLWFWFFVVGKSSPVFLKNLRFNLSVNLVVGYISQQARYIQKSSFAFKNVQNPGEKMVKFPGGF